MREGAVQFWHSMRMAVWSGGGDEGPCKTQYRTEPSVKRFFHMPQEHPPKDKNRFPLRCLGCVSFFSIPIMTFPPSLHLSLFPWLSFKFSSFAPAPSSFLLTSASTDSHFPLPHDLGLKMAMTSGHPQKQHLSLTWDHEGSPKSPHPAVQYGSC